MPSNKDKNKSHELDETLKRLGQHSGVMGTIVVNSEGETHFSKQALRRVLSSSC